MMTDGTAATSDNSIPELVRAAGQGDKESLNRLLATTHPIVLDFLRRRGTGGAFRDLEEDVAIEVLVRVAAHVHACRAHSESEYWAWVLTIARREALRLFRSTYFARADILAPAVLDTMSESMYRITGAESAIYPLLPLLETILARLSDDRLMLLELRFIERLEHSEIAHELGISESAAKRRMQRLLAALRRELSRKVDSYAGPDSRKVHLAFRRLAQDR